MTHVDRITDEEGQTVMKATVAKVKASRPDLPSRAIEVIIREILALIQERMQGPGGFLEQYVPIYHKFFTHAEIKELLAFYQTDLGRKFIDVLPILTSEAQAAGRKFGGEQLDVL